MLTSSGTGLSCTRATSRSTAGGVPGSGVSDESELMESWRGVGTGLRGRGTGRGAGTGATCVDSCATLASSSSCACACACAVSACCEPVRGRGTGTGRDGGGGTRDCATGAAGGGANGECACDVIADATGSGKPARGDAGSTGTNMTEGHSVGNGTGGVWGEQARLHELGTPWPHRQAALQLCHTHLAELPTPVMCAR